MKTFYCTLTQGSVNPKGYLKINAPSETDARLVAKYKLGKDWSFIYTEQQFEDQIEKWDLEPLHYSPITVTKDDMWYYKMKLEEQSRERA